MSKKTDNIGRTWADLFSKLWNDPAFMVMICVLVPSGLLLVVSQGRIKDWYALWVAVGISIALIAAYFLFRKTD